MRAFGSELGRRAGRARLRGRRYHAGPARSKEPAMQKPLGPYTPVVRAGDWLIVSGQVGARDGVLADGVPAQTAQAIENLSAQLATMGATLADIKKTLCFLIDMDEFATFNEAYIAGFGDSRPGPVHGGRGRAPHGRAGRDRGLGLQARVMAVSMPGQKGRGEPVRCEWALGHPIVTAYHDDEWGAPAAGPDDAVRVPDPRGRAGRLVVAHDPEQAGGLPRRLRRLRPRRGRRLRRARHRTPAGRCRASCATGPRSAAALGNARAWVELDDPVAFLWELRRRPSGPGSLPVVGRDPGHHRGLRTDEQGAQAARVPLRRGHDLLLADAGLRPRQRPRHGLLPPARGAPSYA